jgi:two-component system, chemotaxis family, chemotaxis protein CheY
LRCPRSPERDANVTIAENEKRADASTPPFERAGISADSREGVPTMKFLVVDDSSTMRRIVINTLTKAGYSEFAEAGNGTEGMAELAKSPVDMVITDWNMPVMNGLEFVRAIRANAGSKDVPVLMVTTNAAKDDILEALKAGVNDYVIKPFTPDVIKTKITTVVGK